MTKTCMRISSLIVLGMLSACSDPSPTSSDTAAESKPVSTAGPAAAAPNAAVAAKAETKAAAEKPDEYFSAPESLGRLRCPVESASTESPDIVGIRIGMSFDNALMVLRCHTKDKGHFNWMTSSLAIKNSQGYLEKQGIQLKVGRRLPGCDDLELKKAYPSRWEHKCLLNEYSYSAIKEDFSVMAPGPTGKQTVVGLWREQNFEKGKEPSAETILAALTQKYGAPVQPTNPTTRDRRLYWQAPSTLDSAAPLKRGSHTCISSIPASANQGSSFGEGCGLTITAEISTTGIDGALVSSLKIGMADQDLAIEVGDQTQADVDQRRAQAREAELEKAAPAEDIKL